MQIKLMMILHFKAEITVQQMSTHLCQSQPTRRRKLNPLDPKHPPDHEVDQEAPVMKRTAATDIATDIVITEINIEPSMQPKRNHAAEPGLDRAIEVGQVHGNAATDVIDTEERKNGKGRSILLPMAWKCVTTQFHV